MGNTYSLNQVVPGHCIDDRYEIIDTLGSGGMSIVYRARHLNLDRTVAIKFIRKDLLGPENAEHGFAERFKQEGRAMAKVRHPNSIAIYDLGALGNGTQFMVMEYFQGETLGDVLDKSKNGAIDQLYALDITQQLLQALVAVHGAGITHYDIKPPNIMIGKDADGGLLVKLLDFGIAKIRSPDTSGNTRESADDGRRLRIVPPGRKEVFQTAAFAILGTPDYMAPEATAGLRVSMSSDIYSLGAVLFEMLTGRTPYLPSEESREVGPHAVALDHFVQHRTAPVPNAATIDPTLDSALVNLVQIMMAKAPDERLTAAALLPMVDGIRDRLRRQREQPSVGGRIRSATVAFVGKVQDLDRALAEQVVANRIAASDTGSLGQEVDDDVKPPTFMERWGPWVREKITQWAQRWRLLLAMVGAVLLAGTCGYLYKYFTQHETISPEDEVISDGERTVPQAEPIRIATPDPVTQPAVIAPVIPYREFEEVMAQRSERYEIETVAPTQVLPPVAVVAVDVAPIPQPPPEVVTIKPPKPKATPAQLFQQASAAFASGKKDKACSLAKRAIAAAENAKPGSSNAMRKATSQFGCGP